jgi:two-component system nitrogen regulation sensor histidine kinase NtrY
MTRVSSKVFSLQGKFVFFGLALVGLTLALLSVAFVLLPFWWALILCLVILVPVTILAATRLSAPLVRVINALADSTDNIKDHDYSVTIASSRNDELGDLVKRHNEVGQLLREERHNINQRELLLDTVLQSTPVAMLLCDDSDHVVYSNIEARQLLAQGKRLQGLELSSLLTPLAEELAQAIASQREGLISIETDGELETYYLSCGFFSLNNRVHKLHLIRHMTREISRQEVTTWKRVIRVISHELNNSLAPISSLSHSGKLVMSRLETATQLPLPELEDWQKLQLILSSIGERASHLKDFIEGYARFARLPAPRIQLFDLVPMLNRIAAQQRFEVVTAATLMEVRLDETQCEQVLINLVKNARDAAGETGSVRVEAGWRGKDLLLIVSDDGPGMSDQVLRQALLPFYSTKKEGTGLGLPLSREIVEAHGGQLSIRNRQISGIDVVMRIPQ